MKIGLSLVILLCLFVQLEASGEVVQTKQGRVRGTVVTSGGTTVHQFLKIPFAKPPVGDLRFKKPQPIDSWNGTLNAMRYGPLCMQKVSSSRRQYLKNANVSEDCLYLNVYIPRAIDRDNLKAVMVYIHGGGYATKSGTTHDPTLFSQLGDVVVVTTNYRLNIFGFFSTGDSAAEGNYGLWDQIEALKWVQNNIREFGGDPSRVTIFGHSAGGYSVGLLAMSPKTENLFQRAVPMCGVGLTGRAVTRYPQLMAYRIAKKLNCINVFSSKGVAKCIKSKSADDILETYSAISAEDKDMEPQFIMRPAPVIDGELLPDFPQYALYDRSSMSYKRFMDVDYMAGTAIADGGLIRTTVKELQDDFNFEMEKGIPTAALCHSIAPALSRDYYDSEKTIAEEVCKTFSYNVSEMRQAEMIADMYGDMMYHYPAVETLRLHSESERSSYQFLFSYKSSFEIVKNLPEWIVGAYHGDEVPFIFRQPQYTFSSEDKAVSDQFIRYLTNFAKYGNPNGDETESTRNLRYWPAFENTNQSYMEMNTTFKVGNFFRKDHLNFWHKFGPISSAPGSRSTLSYLSLILFAVILF